MIYLGRPGLWQDWQRFQAEARKSRRYAEKMAEKRKARTNRICRVWNSFYVHIILCRNLIMAIANGWEI